MGWYSEWSTWAASSSCDPVLRRPLGEGLLASLVWRLYSTRKAASQSLCAMLAISTGMGSKPRGKGTPPKVKIGACLSGFVGLERRLEDNYDQV